jgi:hypothetical protein
MLEELFGRKVVIDLKSEYVCLGTLVRADEAFLELKNADLHDLRDTDTTRENYVAESCATGIKRNRRQMLLSRRDVVAIAALEDVVDE